MRPGRTPSGRRRLRDAVDLGVRELTVYSFSTENWSRSPDEIAGLMGMFSERILGETPELHEEGVRMRFIGRREGVAPELIEQMRWAEETTAANDRITLFVAFNYGGRAEIVDAARRFEGGDEEDFAKLLYAPEMHDPDLVIRTSGEAAPVELPAVAVGLLGAALHRRPVARLLAGGPRGGAGGLHRPRPPLRRALMAARPRSRRRRSRGASDLPARVLVAIPAIAFAIFVVASGGWVFTIGALVLGIVCLHELFRMYEGLRPVKLVGFAAVAGRGPGRPSSGDERRGPACSQRLVQRAPDVPALAAAMPMREGVTVSTSMMITVFGVFWIGMAIAHTILLRGTPHGDGILIDILVGTFVGDTGAYLGRALVRDTRLRAGSRPTRPSKGWPSAS